MAEADAFRITSSPACVEAGINKAIETKHQSDRMAVPPEKLSFDLQITIVGLLLSLRSAGDIFVVPTYRLKV